MRAFELQVAPGLAFAGDYNLDGKVSAADYTVYRDTLGESVMPSSGADGSGNGEIDAADYDVWKTNFGRVLADGKGTTSVGASWEAQLAEAETVVTIASEMNTRPNRLASRSASLGANHLTSSRQAESPAVRARALLELLRDVGENFRRTGSRESGTGFREGPDRGGTSVDHLFPLLEDAIDDFFARLF